MCQPCNNTFVVTLNGLDLPYVAYVDTACARSVTGQENADALVSYCKANNWPYLLTADHEPFRFGPGKRIWSQQAVIVIVCWGGIVFGIRFSIVPPQVPFLISKYVFKRLACKIDLDDNELEFKRFGNQRETLYDLPSGHVAIELIKQDVKPPEISAETMELCKQGEEVAANDPEIRKRLANIPHYDNRTHVVQLPSYGTPTVTFDLTADDSESELADCESASETGNETGTEYEISEFLTDLTKNTLKHHTRTRAAPFFNELSPGWRARAIDLAPPYRRNADCDDSPMEFTKGFVDVDVDTMEESDVVPHRRSRKDRKWTLEKRHGEKVRVNMDDEQTRVEGKGPQGPWHDDGSGGEGDGYYSPREVEEPKGSDGGNGRSVIKDAQGIGIDAQTGFDSRMPVAWTSTSGAEHACQNDCGNKDRCSNAHHNGGSLDEFAEGGRTHMDDPECTRTGIRRLGDARCNKSEAPNLDRPSGSAAPADPERSSLFKWASSFVTGVSGRTATLVSRVLHAGNTSPFIASDNDFHKVTQGKETWTQITESAILASDVPVEGLDKPVWRQTTLVDTGKLIESMPLPSNKDVPVPDGPKDIKTTIWYGRKVPQKGVKMRRSLMKGIQTAAAVLLLEAMVLMSTTTNWTGSWTQRLYGTGTADVWEIFGRDNLTNVSWKQGWRPLEPLQAASFNDVPFLEYVSTTLEEKAPRLVVMETPGSVWYHATKPVADTHNSVRNSTKRFNKKVTPFLEVAQEIAMTQVNEGRDFLLELPLTTRLLKQPTAKDMADNPFFHVMNGTSWNRAKPAWWMSSSPHITKKLDSTDTKVHKRQPTKEMQDVMIGFAETLHQKEPERIQSLIRSIDARLRGVGLYADECMVNLVDTLGTKYRESVYAVIDEKTPIPEAGIEFDLPPELHGKIPKSLLSSVRRLHFNSGHPPNDELERIVRLSGGSELARAAVKGIRCTICRKAAPARSPKPAKAKTSIGQFNETVLADLCYEKDSNGTTHAWMLIVDDGTDWTVCKYLGASPMVDTKTAKELYNKVEEGWIDWAGPPDVFVADSERGFAAEEFAGKLGKAGSFFQPAAGYAPWQKGKVERKVKTICSIIRKSVLHLGLKGAEDMKYAGIEAASAVNQRPGSTGVSPGMMLFGQRLKLYGELYANGEPAYHHLDGNDASSELGRRLQIRCTARQATEAHYAKEMVRKTVAARTRLVDKVDVGETVFFYRCYPSLKAQKLQAQRGCYLGPGLVIGMQGSNYWISYAGRCYLVAPEHLRSLAPDEVCSTKPLIRQGLEELRRASQATDYLDLTQQQATPADLQQAAEVPAGNDFSAEAPLESVDIPQTPVQEAPAEPIRVLEPPDEMDQLQRTVDEHMADPENPTDTTATETEASGEKRKAEEPESSAASSSTAGAPVSWRPQGDTDNLKWKKSRSDPDKEAFEIRTKRIVTAKIKKKMLDKEIPYKEIPMKDRHLYHKAEEKEWSDWLKNKSVRIVKGKEVHDILRDTPASRIINLRFVYRDKNASIRTPQVWLPVKAKARMCAQGFTEPLARAGLVKLDSPTVQRIGIMVFLQITANFGWFDTWRKGDISSAFLQGTDRDAAKGRLFLRPPKGKVLAGVDEGDILEVLKSVYGLPDAPRAWWEEVTGFLRGIGFEHSRLDVAFMVCYHDDGSLGAMIILHVDDVMVATDGTPYMEAKVEEFHKKYPFGEWENVKEVGEVTYTGRQISLHGNEIHLGQADFIKGRMDNIPMARQKKSLEEKCTPTEHAEFRSGVGNLHWVTSQTRVDHAVDTSRLQKRQNAPTFGDYKDLAKVVKEVKSTEKVVIKIRPVQNLCVGAYTDSSLYGSQGEIIPDDEDLAGYDKHKLHSQAGSLIVIMNKDHLDDVGDVPVSMGDWRTRASRRVYHSTFASEAQAAVETYGLAKYYRAYLCDIIWGFADWRPVESFGETEIPIILFTDCKSLYDHLKKDGSVPDDKWVAVSMASLRGAVSAGPGRDVRKSEAKWVPSRWQLADCLTKKGLAASFRERLASGTTKLHELSLQSVKRQKAKSKEGYYVWYVHATETYRVDYPTRRDTPQFGCQRRTKQQSESAKPRRSALGLADMSLFSPGQSGTHTQHSHCDGSLFSAQPQLSHCAGTLSYSQVTPYAMAQLVAGRNTKAAKKAVKEEPRDDAVETPPASMSDDLDAPEFTPSWSMRREEGTRRGTNVAAHFQRAMAPGFVSIPEKQVVEDKLAKIVSGPYVLEEHVEYHNYIKLMPSAFEVYCLETDEELRTLWKGSMRRWPNMTPCLVKMEETDFRHKEKQLLWMGLIVNPEDGEVEGATKDGKVMFSFYVGMPLSQAEKVALNPKQHMLRGTRCRIYDKLTSDECYGGEWFTSLRYTIQQRFLGNTDSDEPQFDVICVVAVDAVSVRPAKQTNGRVQIMKQAYPSMILIRPDDGNVTLRTKDRCMSDYMQSEVDKCFSAKIPFYDRYAEERYEERRRKVLGPHQQKKRKDDLELAANSEAMSAVSAQGQFYRMNGTRPMTNAEVRELLKVKGPEDDEPGPDSREPDPEGWPTGHLPAVSTFKAEQYFTDMQYDPETEDLKRKVLVQHYANDERPPKTLSVPGRTEEELAAFENKYRPYGDVDPMLYELLKACREGKVKSNDKRWKEFDLHEIANALRFGSPTITRIIMRSTYDFVTGMKQQVREESDVHVRSMMKNLNLPPSQHAGEDREKVIQALDHKKAWCIKILKVNTSKHSCEWRDPTWVRLQEAGWTKYEATCDLRDRISAALYNLSQAQTRGCEWLDWQSWEYAEGSYGEPLARPPVEYESVERVYNIEDDNKNAGEDWQISQAWLAKTMNQVDPKFNQESARWIAHKRVEKLGKGYFNPMDGRFHEDRPKVNEGHLMIAHMERTEGRRLCPYFQKGYCKLSYTCTMAHLTEEMVNQRALEAEYAQYRREKDADDARLPRKKQKWTPKSQGTVRVVNEETPQEKEKRRRWEKRFSAYDDDDEYEARRDRVVLAAIAVDEEEVSPVVSRSPTPLQRRGEGNAASSSSGWNYEPYQRTWSNEGRGWYQQRKRRR